MRFFTTEGPVNPMDHYCLPPLARIDMEEIRGLIAQKKYFLLHAPRQTGKTSCLLALADLLNREGTYQCVYANLEPAQALREDVDRAMALMVSAIARWASLTTGEEAVSALARAVLADTPHADALGSFLTRWCQQLDKPLVLLLDEVDALIGDTLIALLRQLRASYPTRPHAFPQSVLLCGVRDLQDYRIHSSREQSVITGGSAFNIKAESLRLGDFSQPEVETLLAEHTQETGQIFTPAARTLVWELTQGQPWLVNALAYETTWRNPEGRDRSQAIDAPQIQQAKENLILRRVTHLDQLADKLQEPRVRRVVESILVGVEQPEAIPPDDISYVRDLGLVKTEGQLQIANPIYQEVIPRELTYSTQLTISQQTAWYLHHDGRLDLPKLLAAFQHFFREHSKAWLERFDYREAGPQLLLQAFLQRIINGGGRVDREYGLGRRCTDLCVVWNYPGGVQRGVIELKIRYASLEQTLAVGLEQTWRYADATGAEEAHLVIFDRRPKVAWSKKIWRRSEQYAGMAITVWGM